MSNGKRNRPINRSWWGLALLAAIVVVVGTCLGFFAGTFDRVVAVTLTSERSGLVMEPGAKVKLRGVQVGRVQAVRGGTGPVSLTLELFPDQVQYIPANVQAQIRATTAFGAKYVDLSYPSDPAADRLRAGAVIVAQNVSTEVNTVFQNLNNVLDKVDPSKLNAILTALSDGLRGQGQAIGEATSGANRVLSALNARSDALSSDWQSLKGFSDTYGAAAPDILAALDALSVTSTSITTNAGALDALLANVIGFSTSGTNLLAPSKDNFVTSINALESTTRLLHKYSPEYTCLLQAGTTFLEQGGYSATGSVNRNSLWLDVAILLGDDAYRYPDNLPKVAAKGGPGGKPGCGSLPDVAKNWPVRSLITDTGWGTGIDWRPNPGIGFPGYANYFPGTRAVPEPPSVRNPGGPAIGPVPYPGAPPHGAQLYAPDGAPLWPGLPPAPPPGLPRDPGPRPGSEPFVVPVPAHTHPTPGAPPPVPAAPR
ncbi:MCE family protein [Mycobacterium sp. SMC-8]|uniref:MCE family protein n=1 Tax=Mycobacterium sp. SMC-8 TaxID=2857060 RepID=UPI0021B1BC8F|nr:MCE family protein [Mycobacterium sp. SMC-8]UXA11570.1 MCE family protein [Mycobacterium sp. SMC-8]